MGLPELETQESAARPAACAESLDVGAWRVTLSGHVQGFGVRPAIARLAERLGLVGAVWNCNDGITIHIEGSNVVLTAFRDCLKSCLPRGAQVANTKIAFITPQGCAGFRIEPSYRIGALAARVPADLSICGTCLHEVEDRGDRRRAYAFISCTSCGPRYSLIRAMPYDRGETTMAQFRQCAICDTEYRDPNDRRFHSQTNCCAECGPGVWLTGPGGEILSRGDLAIKRAVEALLDQRIVALRGVGGYQLLVDATSESAVQSLRARKERYAKPFAVMVSDLASAEHLADLEPAERSALLSPANPIVVARLRAHSPLAFRVTAGLNTLGLMLPTTALHAMVTNAIDRPLVATSGNREGEPLAFETVSAHRDLAGIADFWLDHDREINRTVDDSVVRVMGGQQAAIRLGRGLAPLPLELTTDQSILAVGGHQKAAIAISNGAQCVLGPHVGDLDTEPTRVRYLDHVETFCELYALAPSIVVHDLHPDYFTTRWALNSGIPAIAVQHHHAHVVSGMIEPGWLDDQVLGVAWDGTGYGPDGSIWGGEFLLATSSEYRRVACLRPFFLPGGEVAVHQPWRVALALAYQVGGIEMARRHHFPGVPQQLSEGVLQLIQRSAHGVWTTSAGRLFDGIACLVLDASESLFEGQPAMLLEAIVDTAEGAGYSLPLCRGQPATLDWRSMVATILADLRAGRSPESIAMKFHRALADGIAAVAGHFAGKAVVLTGGCFQNRILTELVIERTGECERPLAAPGIIPVGDGGLAAGQLAIAIARQRQGLTPCA